MHDRAPVRRVPIGSYGARQRLAPGDQDGHAHRVKAERVTIEAVQRCTCFVACSDDGVHLRYAPRQLDEPTFVVVLPEVQTKEDVTYRREGVDRRTGIAKWPLDFAVLVDLRGPLNLQGQTAKFGGPIHAESLASWARRTAVLASVRL